MAFGNKLDSKVGDVSNKAGDVSNEVGDIGDKMGDVGDKVGNVGDKGNEVGSSNKDKEDGKKVDGEDKPEEISIDKETTNLLNAKPKPPKSKFRVKDAIKAKFRPDIEYTASIAIEAEGGSVEEIVMAKNANSDWNWYNKTGLLEKLKMERLKGGNPVEALTELLKKMKLGGKWKN